MRYIYWNCTKLREHFHEKLTGELQRITPWRVSGDYTPRPMVKVEQYTRRLCYWDEWPPFLWTIVHLLFRPRQSFVQVTRVRSRCLSLRRWYKPLKCTVCWPVVHWYYLNHSIEDTWDRGESVRLRCEDLRIFAKKAAEGLLLSKLE